MDNNQNPNQFTASQLYYDCISEDQQRQQRGFENLGYNLYASALYLVDTPEDAQDLVQTTLIKVYNNLNDVKSCKAFKAWARTILRNECIRWYHRNPDEQELPYTLSDQDLLKKIEMTDEAIERLFNAPLGRKTKWAWIGRYYYNIPFDRELAEIENLLCETSIQESTYPVIRAKTKMQWVEMDLVKVWRQAKFSSADPSRDDALDPMDYNHVALQKLLQRLLITKEWRLLYDAPLDRGSRWSWIGLYVYELDNENLARVENLLCNSAVDGKTMSDRRRSTQQTLDNYLAKL